MMADAMLLASGEYATIGILVVVALALTGGILVAAHLLGPKRVGPRKHDIYESGMEPVGDTRRRFQVRFYLIAVLFLVFDVELLFLYPWVVLFPRLHAAAGTEHHSWAQGVAAAGYTPGFVFAGMSFFFLLLLVGFVYEWRRGVFKWN